MTLLSVKKLWIRQYFKANFEIVPDTKVRPIYWVWAQRAKSKRQRSGERGRRQCGSGSCPTAASEGHPTQSWS